VQFEWSRLDYKEALTGLLGLTDLERVSGKFPHRRRYNLNRMEHLLHLLGNPHLGLPTVHIAGTKGKGSVAALISSALSADGYHPGLFTSPHLHSFRERIQRINQPITEDEFVAVFSKIWPLVEKIGQNGECDEVTTFELLTAMAFEYFRSKNTDINVVEVGMGGRIDSTNLVEPSVSVITPISLDHTHVLGNTIEKIAKEKAGIIKTGAPVVVGPQSIEAIQVIRKFCREKDAPMLSVDKECSWGKIISDIYGQSFWVSSPWGNFEFWTPLLGRHQIENAVTSFVALQLLKEHGITVSHKATEQGFRNVRWPARLEVLGQQPLVVIDGAHNPHSALRLINSLHDYFSFSRLIGIVGILQDKSLKGIVKELAPSLSVVIATKSRHPRSASASSVGIKFRELGVKTYVEASTAKALSIAQGIAEERDLIIVTGSLFVGAEARESLLHINPEIYPDLLPRELQISQ